MQGCDAGAGRGRLRDGRAWPGYVTLIAGRIPAMPQAAK